MSLNAVQGEDPFKEEGNTDHDIECFKVRAVRPPGHVRSNGVDIIVQTGFFTLSVFAVVEGKGLHLHAWEESKRGLQLHM